jgi:hypothetical protein
MAGSRPTGKDMVVIYTVVIKKVGFFNNSNIFPAIIENAKFCAMLTLEQN